MADSLNSRIFGYLPTGEPIEAWTLNGQGGLVLEAITYGGIVRRLLVPDHNGKLADVVLGFDNLDSYLASRAYFGAIIGRVAGRLTDASFCLEGSTYELARNGPPNHLHGGVHGFDKKIWTATPVDNPFGAPSLRLNYRSPDGEEGYPGTVDVTVIYTATSNNAFLIETEAVTDSSTPFNLTHHSYFNLGGEANNSIVDHELLIRADEFVATDEHMTLLGRIESVTNHGNDFRQRQSLGKAIPCLFQNHGDLYVIRRPLDDRANFGPMPAAQLIDPGSGRTLEVSTTETHLQLYTGASLDGTLVGKSNQQYGKHAGVCLECQGYPDGINASHIGNTILRPGHPQRHITSYSFQTL
jgi:aldose 1-epimerase